MTTEERSFWFGAGTASLSIRIAIDSQGAEDFAADWWTFGSWQSILVYLLLFLFVAFFFPWRAKK